MRVLTTGARTAAPLLAVVLVLGCAGGTRAPTSSTPTSSPSPTASPRLTTAAPNGRPLQMGTLAAGTYRTDSFAPTLVFTLPDGFSQFFPHDEDEIALGGREAELLITRPAEVIDPDSRQPVAAPDDLLAWILDHPDLAASDPTAVQVAGLASSYTEIQRRSSDVRLFHYATGDIHLPPATEARIYVVPLDGPELVVLVLTPSTGVTLDAAVLATESIVESLTIAP